MAAQLAGDAVGLDIEDNHDAIVLAGLAGAVVLVDAAAYPSRGQQIAAVTEADRSRVAAACAGCISRGSNTAATGANSRRRPVMTSGQSCARTKGSTSDRFIAADRGGEGSARGQGAAHVAAARSMPLGAGWQCSVRVDYSRMAAPG